ncbi:MAG TPA: alanine racemase, partial [Clostridiales bacterium]|nr:alanine racemase [Clostridiales bacterium]
MLKLAKTRPVWAEINLDHLAHNMKEIRKLVPKETLVTAVVKADGYGHGAVEIAETLLENGADRLAVGT